jgi:hypothetical protein
VNAVALWVCSRFAPRRAEIGRLGDLDEATPLDPLAKATTR